MFKSRLCFYINLHSILLHFISAKIYISQINFKNINAFALKNKNFFVYEKIKSRLCSYISLDFLQFLFIYLDFIVFII